MIVILVCVTIIVLVIGYPLVAPFYLEVNSKIGLYRLRLHHFASARFFITDSSLNMELKIAGWHKIIDLFAASARKVGRKKKKGKRAATNKFKPSAIAIKAVIRSFKVNRCSINIDTGVVELNGVLYPVFYWLGRLTGKPIRINFSDENEIILEVENSFLRIITAYFFH